MARDPGSGHESAAPGRAGEAAAAGSTGAADQAASADGSPADQVESGGDRDAGSAGTTGSGAAEHAESDRAVSEAGAHSPRPDSPAGAHAGAATESGGSAPGAGAGRSEAAGADDRAGSDGATDGSSSAEDRTGSPTSGSAGIANQGRDAGSPSDVDDPDMTGSSDVEVVVGSPDAGRAGDAGSTEDRGSGQGSDGPTAARGPGARGTEEPGSGDPDIPEVLGPLDEVDIEIPEVLGASDGGDPTRRIESPRGGTGRTGPESSPHLPDEIGGTGGASGGIRAGRDSESGTTGRTGDLTASRSTGGRRAEDIHREIGGVGDWTEDFESPWASSDRRAAGAPRTTGGEQPDGGGRTTGDDRLGGPRGDDLGRRGDSDLSDRDSRKGGADDDPGLRDRGEDGPRNRRGSRRSTERDGAASVARPFPGSPGDPDDSALVVSALDPSQPDGSVRGYRAEHTLPVRVELARQIRRRRTKVIWALLAVLPLLLLAAFEIGDDGRRGRPAGELVDLATTSGLNFAVYALYSSTGFLLVVMVALFFGDTVAGEANWSSLRYLLAAPVPRGRLLRQKAIVAAILSLIGLVLLPAVALAVGVYWYGAGDLVSPSGNVVPFPLGVLELGLAVVFLALQLSWVAGLALCLSVHTDAPLGAVGGAVLVSIVSQILNQVSELGGLRVYLPTHHVTAWTDLLPAEIDWSGMAGGAFSGTAYALFFAVLALWHFHYKDITS